MDVDNHMEVHHRKVSLGRSLCGYQTQVKREAVWLVFGAISETAVAALPMGMELLM